MAQPSRESVYSALASLLTTALSASVATISRHLQSVRSFPPASAPALFLVQAGEHITAPKGIPALRILTVHMVVYSYAGGSTQTVQTTALNALVDSATNAIGPSLVNGFQQLGVPISNATVTGQIQYWEQAGTNGDWAVALIPVELTANY